MLFLLLICGGGRVRVRYGRSCEEELGEVYNLGRKADPWRLFCLRDERGRQVDDREYVIVER